MKIRKSIYSLTNEHLADCVASIENFLQDLKIDKKDKIRIPLMFEEILLNLQAKFGEHTEISLFFGNKCRLPSIIIHLKGDRYNPLIPESEDEEEIFILTHSLREQSMLPTYSYYRGVNTISFVITQKESFLKKITLYSFSALLLAFLGNFCIPEYFDFLRTVFIKPTCDALLGILTLICGPLIFFSICTGILTSSTDTENSSGIGTQVISLYLKKNLLALLFFVVFLSFCFPVSFSGEMIVDVQSFLKEMAKLLFGIIPANIINPFLQGNTIQISLLAVAFGLFFLSGRKKYPILTDIVMQVNLFFQNLMTIVSGYSHIFVFLLLLSLPLTGNSLLSLDILKTFFFISVGYGLYIFLRLLYLSRKLKKSSIFVFKTILPSTLLALTTSSSSVAYNEMVRCCLKDLKLNKNITDISIPMGIALSKDGEIASLLTIAFFTAFIFHTETTLVWIIFSGISIYILAIATPPVPGCLLIILPALFSQLHIPMEAMPCAMLFAFLLDFISTAAKVAGILISTTELDFKNKLLDSENNKQIG